MPLTDRKQAKDSGFAQVRAALQKFEGDVTSAEFGQWGGQMIDPDTGKGIPPKEFLEIECNNIEVLEVTEELSMEIEEWNFRENCSDYNGSFWVEKFLESADKHKLQIPEGLVGKRIVFEKVTLEAFDKNGTATPKFDATNFVIVEVKTPAVAAKVKPAVVAKTQPVATVAAPAVVTPTPVEEVAEPEAEAPAAGTPDPMDVAQALAIGKTEAQFRTAISLDAQFVNSPLLSMAKAGLITQSLVNEGKLVLVGTKYQLPG